MRLLAAASGVIAMVALALAAILLWPGERGARTSERVTILQDDAVFLHRSDAATAAAMADIRSLGVDWLRVTAGWSKIAPDPESRRRPRFDASDPDSYPGGAWSRLDRAVRLAERNGLEVMIDIAFWAPRWAVSRPVRDRDRQRWGIDVREFALFAGAVARRYSGEGELPAAVGYTIWNEPNFATFWLPQWERRGRSLEPASPHRYRAMVRAAYPRIKGEAPKSRVLIGGTAPAGRAHPDGRSDPMPPLRFLREMACVSEGLEPLRAPACHAFEALPGDGWAHHPYSLGDPSISDPAHDNVRIGDLHRLTGLLERLHARGRTRRKLDVWVTEFGYQTDPPDPTQPVTPAQQAAFLPRAELIAHDNPEVRSFAQFLLRDLPKRPGRTRRKRWGDFQSGLRYMSGTPKPAQRAFRYALVARRDRSGGVRFWGHVRPGTGERTVRIATLARGRWRPLRGLGELSTDAGGYFSARAGGGGGSLYRLEAQRGASWRAGVPVRPR